jgi:MarR-like DNA-binding transcriptional regulator SgrR of sgrS sRNA
MLSKYNQEYLDRLKQMADGGEVRVTVPELADKFIVSRDYAKQILYILRASGKLTILKEKGRIVGVRLH